MNRRMSSGNGDFIEEVHTYGYLQDSLILSTKGLDYVSHYIDLSKFQDYYFPSLALPSYNMDSRPIPMILLCSFDAQLRYYYFLIVCR
jgi:hypothetical protein